MALGHRFKNRNGLWPLTIGVLILWILVIRHQADSRHDPLPTALTARRVIENAMLTYDDALRSDHPTAWQHWQVLDDSPKSVELLAHDLEKKSLMTAWLRVDVALAYHHFAQTTGNAHWDKQALAMIASVGSHKEESRYFSQADAALHGRPLSESERTELTGFCAKWPQDWWIVQLAHLHGMDGVLDHAKIGKRERRAGWQALIEFGIQCLMLTLGLVFAWPAWRILKHSKLPLNGHSGDRVRHLRRLWPPVFVLLSFALVELILQGVGKSLEMSKSSIVWISGNEWIRFGVIVALLVLAVISAVIQPISMRWCLAPGFGSLRRVFDLRKTDFRDRRWWWIGIAGSGVIYSTFYAVYWALQKAGYSTDETDQLTRTFRVMGVAALPFALFWGGVVAPVVEEFVYRGFLFTALKNRYGPWAGAVVSSVIFTWGHFYGWLGTVEVFIYGMVLCLVYQRTGRLAASMILHGCINLPLVFMKWLDWSA